VDGKDHVQVIQVECDPGLFAGFPNGGIDNALVPF
jgi:hypothetical protein